MRSLIAWDAQGNIVATLDYMVTTDESGNVVGLVDFEEHEANGGRLRDVWENSAAVGSATWPEWIGMRAHDFAVDLDPSPGAARASIKALVHKKSGHRRIRADIEAAIAERINEKKVKAKKEGDEVRKKAKALGLPPDGIPDPEPEPADVRDIVGGPDRPLQLDENGRTKPKVKTERSNLPVVAVGRR